MSEDDIVKIISEEDLPDDVKKDLGEFSKMLGSNLRDFILYNRLQSDLRERMHEILDNQTECNYISKIVKELVKKSVAELGEEIKKMKNTEKDKMSYESYLESLVHLLKIYTAVYKVGYSLKIHMLEEYKIKRQIIDHVDLEAQYDTEKSADMSSEKMSKIMKDNNIQVNVNTEFISKNEKKEERKDSYIA